MIRKKTQTVANVSIIIIIIIMYIYSAVILNVDKVDNVEKWKTFDRAKKRPSKGEGFKWT